jgi:glutathione S-transferase
MQLIGMLDSAYVRRVAISMKLMGIAFEHRPVSVFRHYGRFREARREALPAFASTPLD